MLKIDYKFKDESLLRLAMTHSSYANEHHGTHLQCNERLEFLGDSVLGFVTAGYLFTHYPDLPEGDLTKLRAAVVCEGALDEIAHEIGIPEAIRLGHGEEMGGGRKRASILADATEALLGAIFMATDYATSPVTKKGQLIFGIGCGLITCFIRRFGSYPEGVCYSILIMNCTTWLLDKYVRPTIYGAPKKEKKEAAAK